jgi:putative peptidoglycan lipid II flippase
MQVNLLVGTMIASLLPTGAVAYLYYADRLYQLPLGVIGIAIGTALLPRLARELRGSDLDAAGHTTNRAIEVALLLTLPASAALLILAGPIVSVLFERGAFTLADTAETAWTLAAYAVGLPAFVLVKVLAPAFFAREDTRTPVIVAAWTMAANILLSIMLVFPFEHVGLAMATSLASWINAGWLAVGLNRRGFLTADRRLLRAVPRLAAASLAMSAALAAVAWPMTSTMHGGSALGAGILAAVCAGGAVFFFAAAHVLGAVDFRELRDHLRRRRPS